MVFLFVAFSVPGRIPAQSCEDLQLVGIGNGSFVIQKGSDESLQDCAIPGTLEVRFFGAFLPSL